MYAKSKKAEKEKEDMKYNGNGTGEGRGSVKLLYSPVSDQRQLELPFDDN
jgi:hypothetical protein